VFAYVLVASNSSVSSTLSAIVCFIEASELAIDAVTAMCTSMNHSLTLPRSAVITVCFDVCKEYKHAHYSAQHSCCTDQDSAIIATAINVSVSMCCRTSFTSTTQSC
jgi:hypothetical protein